MRGLLALISSLLSFSILAADGLQFDGWQRINTGYCPVAGDRFECEVTVDGYQPRGTAALFGTVREQEPERTFAFYVRQKCDDSAVVAYGGTERGGSFPRGKKVTLSVGPDGATWTCDEVTSRLELTPGLAMDGVTPLMIGDANVSGYDGKSSPAGTGTAMTLHRFRIWRGGLELIHDYEPVGKYLQDKCGGDDLMIDPVNGVITRRVTVEDDIPNVHSVDLYDQNGRITGKREGSSTVYTVRDGDDIFAYYTLDPNYIPDTANPIAYKKIDRDQTINGNTIKTLSKYVKVTVENAIPHVTNVVVISQQAGEIKGTVVDGNTVYAVERWHDIVVRFDMEPDYVSLGKNSISYPKISEDVKIEAAFIKTIRRLEENIPYRTWDAKKSAMVECVCSNAFPVTADMQALADGKWYAVTGTVSRGTIEVCGSAHLILCDGKTLTAAAITDGAFTVYGQPTGCGELEVPGTVAAALTVQGGKISAGALSGDSLAVLGGTVTADDVVGGKTTIDGGSVKAGVIVRAPTNGANAAVWCVTVMCPGMSGERGGKSGEGRGLRLEGLGGYGTNDIFAVKNDEGVDCVYLWLPNGTYQFAVSDGETTYRYRAVVNGKAITAELLGRVGFRVNYMDVAYGKGPGWCYTNGVLSLTNAMTYVLSGTATNNEVQVQATTDAARVVLSNAAVFASGRPAITVKQKTNLTVAENQVLKTGATPGTLRYAQTCNDERCVLAGPGVTVTVKKIQHVTGFTVSNAVEVIANVTGDATCRVMAGDDVYVGYVVEKGYFSDAANPLVWRSIKDGIVVDANMIVICPSTISYRAWNATERRMEDLVCTNYTVVKADTTTFENGKWYAVMRPVNCGTITVNNSAHLILCDDTTLTAKGGDYRAGIEVREGNAIAIYGQRADTGALVATGDRHGAGIGGGDRGAGGTVTINGGTVAAQGGQFGAGIGGGDNGAGGTVTINGGTVAATGGENFGAGIGGGDSGAGGTVTINGGAVTATGGYAAAGIGGGDHGAGGTVTINGGTVTATGGYAAAGIGGGDRGAGGAVTINGGTVAATGGDDAEDVGKGRGYESEGTLTIDGGSIKVARVAKNLAKNSTPTNVYCVTVRLSEEGGAGSALRLEGLGDYGTNDIFAINGYLYLWLPNGTSRFTVSDGTTTNRYRAVVSGEGITVDPLPTYGFLVNGVDVGDGSDMGWSYTNGVLSLTNAMTYVLSGVATNNEVQIRAADVSKVVLSNMVVFATGRPALAVSRDNLTIAVGEILMTGETPATLKYAKTYGDEPCILVTPVVPITPGIASRPFATAGEATNAMEIAVISPRDNVAAVLGTETLWETYCNMFGFAVTGGGNAWFIEAVLTPTAQTRLFATVTNATRQIPVAAIARLSQGVTTNVTVQGCETGFFYSLYDGWALTNVVADANATNLDVLCGADAKVVFPEVKKPSEQAGFFNVGVDVLERGGKR